MNLPFGFRSTLIAATAVASLGLPWSPVMAAEFAHVLDTGAVAIGDLNNDGWPDLVGGSSLWTNNRDGTFTHSEPFGGNSSPGISLGDYNNDGRLDVLGYYAGENDPGGTGAAGPRLFTNRGSRGWLDERVKFAAPTITPAWVQRAHTWGDFNGDGYLDAYISAWCEPWLGPPDDDLIYTSRGGRSFTHTWTSGPDGHGHGVTPVDFDRDGDLDVYVSNYWLTPNFLWRNDGFDGANGFSEVGGDYGANDSGHTIGSAIADFNNDGEFDIFVCNFAHPGNPTIRFLENRGAAGDYRFTDRGTGGVIQQEPNAAAAAADFDNDGDLDLIVTVVGGYGGERAKLYRNDGDFSFSEVTGEYGLGGLRPSNGGANYKAAWGDYNNDGFVDLIADGKLFKNPGLVNWRHHYLKIKLVGGEGEHGLINGAAIGAQVRIEVPGLGTLTRQVEANTGEGMQNDLTLHFGLGTHGGPVDAEIFWPDGSTRTVTGIRIDQQITISPVPLVTITSPIPRVTIPTGLGLVLAGRAASAGVTTTWSVSSSPVGGNAMITDPGALTTGVTFTAPGDYLLHLTGVEGGQSSIEQIAVKVLDTAVERPLAWWPLDDGAGRAVADVSGHGFNGARLGFADNSAGWVTGRFGGAINFSGEAEELLEFRSHAEIVAGTGSGTITAWFNSDSSGEHTIFSYARGAEAMQDLRVFLDQGRIHYQVRTGADPEITLLSSPGTHHDGAWHHVAVTVDRSRLAILYIDGQAVATGTQPFLSAVAAADRMTIGSVMNLRRYRAFFDGRLDEIRLYDRALSPETIAWLFTDGSSGMPLIFGPETPVVTPGATLPLDLLGVYVENGTTVNWTQVAGPGNATISEAAQLGAEVIFPVPGTYTLRLQANGPAASSFRDVSIDYLGGAEGSPIAFGIPDLTVSQNLESKSLDLSSVFKDPDDPTLDYSIVAQTGDPIIADTLATSNPARLTLFFAGSLGRSRITVQARDPAGNVVESSFSVTVVNTAPVLSEQDFVIGENLQAGEVVGLVTAVDEDQDPLRYFLLSGNTEDAFHLDRSTGVLSVHNPSALDFERNPEFSLQIAVTDPSHRLPQPITVTIDLTNLEESPLLADGEFPIDREAANGTVVGTIEAVDSDGDALTFSIDSGNPRNTFAIDSTTGVISVADRRWLDALPEFVLQVRAEDPSGRVGLSRVVIYPIFTLFSEDAAMRWLVPPDDSQDALWRATGYDDSTWTVGMMGIGYDTTSDYDPFIATDVEAQMHEKQTSLYLRVPFELDDPSGVKGLTLRARVDDGFIAYLADTVVAAENAPDDPNWRSSSLEGRPDFLAVEPTDFVMTKWAGALVSGQNVLALHGLNRLDSSSDFLFSAELLATASDVAGRPVVRQGGSPAVTTTSATVFGELERTTGPTAVYVVWARRDHGPFAEAWPQRALVGVFEDGEFEKRLEGLDLDSRYSLRFFGEVGSGQSWSAEGSFVTAGAGESVLVGPDAPVEVMVPARAGDGAGWRERDFVPDRDWISGRSGVGFSLNNEFDLLISLDIESEMSGRNATAYVRFPFLVADPDSLSGLILRMQYDDGFVAYLNGVEVARDRAPSLLEWDSRASEERGNVEVGTPIAFDLTSHLGALYHGQNVLAIHGLNHAVENNGFLIKAELTAQGDAGAPGRFEWWAHSRGLRGSAALSGANPDHDRLTNHEEFLFGEDPLAPGSKSLRSVSQASLAGNRFLVVRYGRRASAAEEGLAYTVQLSTDLQTWQDVPVTELSLTVSADGESAEVAVRLDQPITALSEAFVRIAVGPFVPPTTTLAGPGHEAFAYVPTVADVPGWKEILFDHSSWASGPLAVGYERGSGYEGLLGLDVGAEMWDTTGSVYVRVPFFVADPAALTSLNLRMKYDDGFVAYLNGVRVASANDPAILAYDSLAAGNHGDSEAVTYEDFDVTSFLGTLVPRQNVLAIHGLNATLTSSDLLILPELVATEELFNDRSAYEIWAISHGLAGPDALPDADPDRDGLENFGEFALAGLPLVADQPRTAPELTMVSEGAESFLELTFRRRLDHGSAGLEYTIESSPDLRHWAATATVEVAVVPAGDGIAELVTVRIPAPEQSGYVRLGFQ